MTVTKERFLQGMTYAEYKAQMTRNQEQFIENERALALHAADLAFFQQLPHAVHVLVITEDWCGDAIANVPILGRLAEATGKLDVRVFLRDQNLDIMDQYLKEGKHRSIPVFVLFDADFRELGYWIERPAAISVKIAEMRGDLFANDPALAGIAPDTPFGDLPETARQRLGQAFGQFRAEHRDFANQEVIRELRGLISGQTVGPVVDTHARVPTRARATHAPEAGQPVKIQITYCAACGYEPQTLELTSALMHEFLYDLAAIEIIPWQDGTFDVSVNGELVHSMARDGGFPENATIIAAVRARMAVPA